VNDHACLCLFLLLLSIFAIKLLAPLGMTNLPSSSITCSGNSETWDAGLSAATFGILDATGR